VSDLEETINILKLQLRTLDSSLLGQDKKQQQRINTALYIFQALCHIFPQTQADIIAPWLASTGVQQGLTCWHLVIFFVKCQVRGGVTHVFWTGCTKKKYFDSGDRKA